MRKFSLLILASVLLFSCSNDDSNELALINNQEETPKLKSADGKYRVLGHGYDITGEYLSKDCIRKLAIDLDSLQKGRGANIIYYNPERGGNTEYYYGFDSDDYTKDIIRKSNFKASISGKDLDEKGLNAFSGSITNNKDLKDTYNHSSKYSFASLNKKVYVSTMRIEERRGSELAKYATKEFLNDLDRAIGVQSREDTFVEDYGTHILTSIEMGGYATILYRSAVIETTTNIERTETVKTGFNVTLNKVGLGSDSDVTVTHKDKYVTKNIGIRLYLHYKGGEELQTSYNLENGIPTISTQSWEKSVTAQNCGLADVDWSRTIFIYDLINDEYKKSRIKAAVERYIASKQIQVVKLLPLYRMFYQKYDNTHYVTTWDEVNEWISKGHKYETILGYIEDKQTTENVPLYRMFYQKYDNTHYVTTMKEVNEWISKGHKYETILGYIRPKENLHTVPLYRMFYQKYDNTHYVTTWEDVIYWKSQGHNYETILGYIYPAK